MQQFSESLLELHDTNFPISSLIQVLNASFKAADPTLAVQRNLKYAPTQLTIGSQTFLLYPDSRIRLVAIGKASLAMSAAANDLLGERIDSGVIVCKHNPTGADHLGNVKILQGNHPVPDHRSVEAALAIQTVVRGLTEHDVVLLLISGGGSALACLPAPGITLQDIQTVTSGLLKSGASINELNAVRKHLDLIKGGGLLKMASPAQVAALVISDVVNSPLDVIASGPAVPDSSTFLDVRNILNQYLINTDIPPAVSNHIGRGCQGEVAETLKPNDPEAKRASHTLIASNQVSAQAALEAAQQEGFNAEIVTCELTGEARLAGEWLVDLIKEKRDTRKPYLGIAGGETTVKVTGQGLGGRNLEVALGAMRGMGGMKGVLLITLATDGEDGPTDAAGAFVTGDTLFKAHDLGLEPETFLANNDAYHFFEKIGALIRTGPSGTNVNDLNFIFLL